MEKRETRGISRDPSRGPNGDLDDAKRIDCMPVQAFLIVI